jgi:glyoxylase-like metal-dependent hydrolase (beta-lactamase superfamily II)
MDTGGWQVMSTPGDGFQEIAPGLYFVPAAGNGGFPFCHSLAADGDQRVLIDAGYGTDQTIAGSNGWRPDTVYVSHAHPDHVATLWTFADAEIWSPVQRSDIFWRFEPMSVRYGGKHASLWLDLIKDTGLEEVTPDRHFDDGHVIDTGRVKLECLHAPGHTDDHYVFFEPTHGIVFTGDIDLTRFGPWYFQDEGDIDLFLASIERVAELKPNMLVSSHKGIITDDIQGRLHRYGDIVRQRDELFLSMLKAPATIDQLVGKSTIFRTTPHKSVLFRYWEHNLIRKHFERLEQRGVVVCEEELWRRV